MSVVLLFDVTAVNGAGMASGAVADFFADIGLAVERGEHAQFIVGDNIAGYYEGYTHSFRTGVGYRMKSITLLASHAAFVNGDLLNRSTDAIVETIEPYGHSAQFDGALEEMLMHSGQTALSLRVSTKSPAELGILPLWDTTETRYQISKVKSVYLLSPTEAKLDDIPRYIAISADQAFHIESNIKENNNWRKLLNIQEQQLQTDFVSDLKTSKFTVHIAFGFTAREALYKARVLASHDSWEQTRNTMHKRLTRSQLITNDQEFNRALVWAQASANSLVVEEFGKGIWAGLPWFRDNWGRDTFISLPGTLFVSGRMQDAKAVLSNFAHLQKLTDIGDPEYGRIPNRVSRSKKTIYNTVDGTPWMIREALEYLRYSGDKAYIKQLLPLIRRYIAGVRRHWLDENGMLTHDDADTWMDARIDGKDAWSPRGNRAVEIQALWFTTLQIAALLSRDQGLNKEANEYDILSATLQQHFSSLFWHDETMADRLRIDGTRDLALRPNQLMLVSIPFTPFVAENIEAKLIHNTVPHLLYPYGMASLDQYDPVFHPRHVNPEFHHKDAAYHNGTVWGWNAGFAITALNKFGYQDLSWEVTQNLAQQILYTGTRGSMSELLDALPDANGKVVPSGTYVQAWSVSEFVRNAYQDYLGFHPDLLVNKLSFSPALPSAWSSVKARLPFGASEAIDVNITKNLHDETWRFSGHTKPHRISINVLTNEKSRVHFEFELKPVAQVFHWDGSRAQLNGMPISGVPCMASQIKLLADLKLAQPRHYDVEKFPVLSSKDVLKTAILSAHSPIH